MNRWASVVQMCKDNNRFAQNRLYEVFARRMFRICMRYLRHQTEAEETLMNGFLKFFRSLPNYEYRDDQSLEHWLKRIMVNEALMCLRQRKIQFESLENEIIEVPTTTPMPDESVGAESIYEAILELPIGYRTVFNLYVVEGYSHEEISQQLGISIGTSKSQLSKARAMLQQLLMQRGYEKYRAV
ncbi:MAG: RNA polymerase sigma factor [Runella sp.]